jgi:phage baseplate assembly protein W
MMPDFGTRIPTLTFEPQDEATIEAIKEDLTMVFDYDPRVKLLDLSLYSMSNENKVVAIAKLFFIEYDLTDELRVDMKFASI